MNFAYEGTEVKGINRIGTGSELTGKCTPQDLVWGMEAEFYTVLDTVLTPLSKEEIAVIESAKAKDNAYAEFNKGIIAKKSLEDYKPLVYDGHNYTMDNNGKANIESMYSAGMSMNGTDLIPTFPATPEMAGNWITDDDELVRFTVDEFIPLALAVVNRFAWNYNILAQHKIVMAGIIADPKTTAEDIASYDYSEGWK